MSSLAAARADNFYHPPNWNPSKISRDKFQKSRGSNQYQQKGLVRFEMPFNFVCDGIKRDVVEHNIGAGTRYNARKKKVGYYFSTPLWEFQMCCHQCGNKIIINTDPKNRAYRVIKGGRIRIENYTAESANVKPVLTDEVLEKKETDKIYALERDTEHKNASSKAKESVEKILKYNQNRENDYKLARDLRRRFKIAMASKDNVNFQGSLLPFQKEDFVRAKIARLRNGRNRERMRKSTLLAMKKVEIKGKPIFGYKTARSVKAKKVIRARRLKAERNICVKL